MKSEVKTLLQQADIPLHLWGINGAKSLDDLVEELDIGECTLDQANGIIRKCNVLYVHATHFNSNNGITEELFEAWIQKPDGIKRTRPYPNGMSLAEKLIGAETPDEESITRAVGEELGITAFHIIGNRGTFIIPEDTWEYPGLQSEVTEHRFDIVIDDAGYQPEGYYEEKRDKKIYFAWRKLPKSAED